MAPSRSPDRFPVDPAPSSLPNGGSVREELPGDPPAGPGDRRAGSYQASPVPLSADLGTDGLEVTTCFLDGDDLSDRPIVQARREPMADGHQCGVGPGLASSGTRQHPRPGLLYERSLRGDRKWPSTLVAPEGAPVRLPDSPPVTRSSTKSCREGGVASGLPGNVRVEPDESRLSEEVDPFFPREHEQLGEDPGCASAPGTVGVVDSDPDRVHPLAHWRGGRAKPRPGA